MSLNHCITQVGIFNDIAGNLDNVTHESLLAQAKVVKEEGDELLEAVQHADVNEILKECVDVLVTIHGFVQMLEKQGYDVLGAWKEVNTNNLSKFTSSLVAAENSVSNFGMQGIQTKYEYNEQYDVYVIKNEHGKVLKPLGYKKCSVASYTPKGVLPKMEVV